MDSPTLNDFQSAIKSVFCRWEEMSSFSNEFRIVGVMDTTQNRYQLQHLESKLPTPISRTLAYLEIRAEKIWIEVDNTEKGIATELVAQGIAKSQIVLAFYPPTVREAGEFAVS
jgi:hypothetical protein